MKKLILLILIITSCSPKIINSDKAAFKVYKIDSIKNYYLIYAKKNDSLYKIISKKDDAENCINIKENGLYNFKLHSILKNRFKNTNLPRPINDLDITCFTFEGDTQICREKGINDLHYADNVKGLCFIKSKE